MEHLNSLMIAVQLVALATMRSSNNIAGSTGRKQPVVVNLIAFWRYHGKVTLSSGGRRGIGHRPMTARMAANDVKLGHVMLGRTLLTLSHVLFFNSCSNKALLSNRFLTENSIFPPSSICS